MTSRRAPSCAARSARSRRRTGWRRRAAWRCSSAAATRSTPPARPGFVLQVVEPHLNGPGGDLPAVFWSAERGEALVLCAQGVAPRRRRSSATARSGTSSSRDGTARGVRAGIVRRLAAAARAVRDVAARRRARVRDRLRGGRLSRRAGDHVRRSSAPSRCCASGRPRPSCTSGAASRTRRSATRSSLRPGGGCSTSARRVARAEIERARRVYYEGFVAEEIDRFSHEHGGLLTATTGGAGARRSSRR